MNEVFNTNLLHPRDQITLIIARIYKRGLTTTSGGNISVIDENGDIWITPSAIDKGTLISSVSKKTAVSLARIFLLPNFLFTKQFMKSGLI
jgi:ribulose-5-phosphate 4-epimerase/fuculose-1-phosphate aldolase